jgi:hypothetical protein
LFYNNLHGLTGAANCLQVRVRHNAIGLVIGLASFGRFARQKPSALASASYQRIISLTLKVNENILPLSEVGKGSELGNTG